MNSVDIGNIVEGIDGSFQSSNTSSILAFEKEYGISLPENYRSFLANYGRCMFSGHATVKTECNSTIDIFTMYGVNCDTGFIGHELEMREDYREKGFIPIGESIFHNQYVIDSSNGQILFLEYSDSEYIIKVAANSFSEFINKIVIEQY